MNHYVVAQYVTYCIVLINRELPDGIYGSGRVASVFKPNKLFVKDLPLRDASCHFDLKHVPEAVEVKGGKAYLYLPVGSMFGTKGIRDAYLCASNV